MALAARAALRVLPLATALNINGTVDERRLEQIMVVIFRATALARVAAKYPARAGDLRAAARYAASAAGGIDAAAYAAASAVTANTGEAYVAGNYAVEAASASTRAATRAATRGATNVARSSLAAASARASALLWEALSADVFRVEAGTTWGDLSDAPLWPNGAPGFVEKSWRKVVATLPQVDGWAVWTSWYEARLRGKGWIEDREIIFAMVPEKIWDEGPAAANAWINQQLVELNSVGIPESARFGESVDVEIRRLPHEWDFFLSYNEKDKAFALFVDDVLRKAGYRVFAQLRDMPAGSDFVVEMNRGLAETGRLVAILSPQYVASKFCQAEWNAAYLADPLGQGRKIVSLLIEAADLAPLAASRVYKSLVGLTSEQAVAAILEAVGKDGVVIPNVDWPGVQALDDMAKETKRVFDVALNEKKRLTPLRRATLNKDVKKDYGGHGPEALYTDMRHAFEDVVEHVFGSRGSNFAFPTDVQRAARKLLDKTPEDWKASDPLAINRALTALMRALDFAEQAGDLPSSDPIEHHRDELRGMYQRLPSIFKGMDEYREKARNDKFIEPDEKAGRAQNDILEKTAADETVASPELAEALRKTEEEIKEAKDSLPPGASAETRRRALYEAYKSAAAQVVPVWNWIINAGKKLGQTSDDMAGTVANFEKLAKRLDNAKDYFEWLSKWWY